MRAALPTLTLERRDEARRTVLLVAGSLRLADASWFARAALRALEAPAPAGPIAFDLSRLERADAGALAVLATLARDLTGAGRPAGVEGASPALAQLLALHEVRECPPRCAPPVEQALLTQLGASARRVAREVRDVLAFVGRAARSALAAVGSPSTVPWREVRPIAAAAGTDALFIVLTINLLVGLILGFQASIQLRRFGADIYVADLVALSLLRELGPIVTAVVVCGRSGAAFAATLGTMRVNEEVDALKVLGFDPLRALVAPRALALVLVVPILTLLGDVVGVAGGYLVGVHGQGISSHAYIAETRDTVDLWDLGQGLIKSVAFAVAIALIACQQGLATSGGAEGVGRRTTSAVVAIILSIIVIDACFTYLFYLWGL